jgi:hypothetical protein
MTETAANEPSPLRSVFAAFIARGAIPVWLGLGAVLKMLDGSPSNLPAALVKWLGGLGLDLRFVLEFSIAVELVVVVAMILLPGLARPIGIAMLALFMPVLVGDLLLGASSCGCFGAVQVPPWVTLATDGFFLLCLVFAARGVRSLRMTTTQATWRVVAVGVLAMLSVAVAFGLTAGGAPVPADGGAAQTAAGSSGPAEGYYLPNLEAWIGSEFASLDLATWIRGLPDDLDVGSQYLLFYRLDCEHCHELMEVYFSDSVPLPTTAVAVPEKHGFPTEGIQPFACGECRLAELPQGFDWFLQTPVLVQLADGIVTCASEVTAESPTCLEIY